MQQLFALFLLLFFHPLYASPLVEELKKYAFDNPEFVTDELLVAQDGKIIFEQYSNGFHKDSKHITWSITKSLINAAAGVAVLEGKIDLQDSICKHIKKIKDPKQCEIKLLNLLNWSSGLQWQESYEKSGSLSKSSVLQMLYGDGHIDMPTFVLKHPLLNEPGKVWNYSSGDTSLLSYILGLHYENNLGKMIREKIFSSLGMKQVTLEEDRSSSVVGSSYLYSTARELAKFGTLFLNDGTYHGKRLLPQNWILESTEPSLAYKNIPPDETQKEKIKGGFAASSWWTNRPFKEWNHIKAWEDLPDDTFMASGHWGQYLIIIPSLKIICVRLGEDRKSKIPVNELMKKVLAIATSGDQTK